MPGSPVLSKVTQAHIDARLGAILGAAEVCFARKGIDRTTMQEIATEAGLSAGAIYRYFPSKEQLLEAVFQHVSENHAAMFQRAVAEHASPLEALFAIGRDELVMTEYGDCALWLESELAGIRDPERIGVAHRRLVDDMVGGIRMLLDRACAAGELPPGTDTGGFALMLYAAVVGLKIQISGGLPAADAERALVSVGALLMRRP